MLIATRETVAHDVQLGERRIDYLKYGNDNMWLQSRVRCFGLSARPYD